MLTWIFTRPPLPLLHYVNHKTPLHLHHERLPYLLQLRFFQLLVVVPEVEVAEVEEDVKASAQLLTLT